MASFAYLARLLRLDTESFRIVIRSNKDVCMSRFRRARVARGCYFFTVIAERRQPILANHDMRLALREAITQVRQVLPFRIDGWVLLPDHSTRSGRCLRAMPISPIVGA